MNTKRSPEPPTAAIPRQRTCSGCGMPIYSDGLCLSCEVDAEEAPEPPTAVELPYEDYSVPDFPSRLAPVMVDAYIRNLPWSDDTPDIHRTLVAGNLRAFAAYLASEVKRPNTAKPAAQEGELLREFLGKLVRHEWMAWAREQSTSKPSWLVPWENLTEPEREVDRRIGERVYRHTLHRLAQPAAQEGHPQAPMPKGWLTLTVPCDGGRHFVHGPANAIEACRRALLAQAVGEVDEARHRAAFDAYQRERGHGAGEREAVYVAVTAALTAARLPAGAGGVESIPIPATLDEIAAYWEAYTANRVHGEGAAIREGLKAYQALRPAPNDQAAAAQEKWNG